MDIIKSVNNELIKSTSKLKIKKNREDFVLIEGEKALSAAIKANYKIKNIFILENSNIKTDKKFENITKIVDKKVMKKIATTTSEPKVVSVLYKKENFKNVDNENILILENIKDEGNLGTIIRTAVAFNIKNIFLLGETVDIYSPKVIRASVGEFFKANIRKINKNELLKIKKTHKFYGTHLKAKKNISEMKFKEPHAIFFGSEASGLTDDTTKIIDENFKINMKNEVESLNLSVSVAITLYETEKNL